MDFKINSRPLFTIIFKPKNGNFKTRDFSPLIEGVLAGVTPAIFQTKFLKVKNVFKGLFFCKIMSG